QAGTTTIPQQAMAPHLSRGERWGFFRTEEVIRSDEGGGCGRPRPRRDGHGGGRGADGPRRRDRGRGGRARPREGDHARVPRPRVRVAVPAQGAPHVRRPRRDRGERRRRRRRCREDRARERRRDLLDVAGHRRDPQQNRSEARGGGAGMSTKELAFAASTVWVLIAAVLVMFLQAGLTRMKNVGHIAAKNVLVLAIASIVYYVVGFGIAFGDGGNGLVGGSGFLPTVDELLTIGEAPFSWFGAIPAAAGYMFEVVFAAVSLAIVWGAMAERTRLWVYFAFGAIFTLIYSVASHWAWSPDGWLFSKGMQDFAGSTVVHYQGALAGLAGA